jgi:L-alanine-DL-glutamate epimerase-like enolase superfamily enzyme
LTSNSKPCFIPRPAPSPPEGNRFRDSPVAVVTARPLNLHIETEAWELQAPLRITGYTFNQFEVVVVRLSDGVYEGSGEASGVYYFADRPAQMVAQIEAVRPRIEIGITHEELRALLPPGGARNALDCALWELRSKQAQKPVWQLADLRRPLSLLTTYTLGAEAPQVMAERAAHAFADAEALKLKLLGDGLDAERVRAVRDVRNDVWIGVDANQGLTPDSFSKLLPVLIEARVKLIEQPFPVGEEAQLDAFQSPIPIAADESVQSLADIPALADCFDVINIKLDKCGGLTEALMMAHEARRLGLDVMVGTMGGTSLAMAPALLVGQLCSVVDLDGPLIMKSDRSPAVLYRHGRVEAPDGVWGWAPSARNDAPKTGVT